ncbi:MAG TPA: hypothetical protein VHD32_08195 [Candidatus Didemnitutus sp.]|nr:hypothetical protein [Candidatus Didemnitutus sp.]
MKPVRPAWRCVLLALGLFLAWEKVVAAAAATPLIPTLDPIRWGESAQNEARKVDAPVEDIRWGNSAAVAGAAEDTATFLVQETDGDKVRQWVVIVVLKERKPAEKEMRTQASTMYLTTGQKAEFPASLITPLSIHVLGPFRAKAPGKFDDVWSGALVSEFFLGAGLDRAVALVLRMEEMGRNDPVLAARKQGFGLGIGPKPPAPEVVAASQEWAPRLNITLEDARAFTVSIPVLMTFFQIASQTPGMRDLLFHLADIPWWQIVKNGGRVENVELEMGQATKLGRADWPAPPGAEVYSLALRVKVEGKPSLSCNLAVTRPVPPLFNSAGILGVSVMRPDGKGPRVMIRLMGGRADISPTH